MFLKGEFLVVYPGLDLAKDTNETKVLPLMKCIPQLEEDLSRPYSQRANRYVLGNSVIYFQGSGSKIVSRSCNYVVGDEVDVWDPSLPENVKDLSKRTRSWEDATEVFVCTPSVENGEIWKMFLEGSQGYFTLRCRECGRLSMRSCDVHNLQFTTVEDEELRCSRVIPGSCRLVCPICGHEHSEEDREWLCSHRGVCS